MFRLGFQNRQITNQVKRLVLEGAMPALLSGAVLGLGEFFHRHLPGPLGHHRIGRGQSRSAPDEGSDAPAGAIGFWPRIARRLQRGREYANFPVCRSCRRGCNKSHHCGGRGGTVASYFLRSSVGPFRLRVVQGLHNPTRTNCRPASSAGVSAEFWRVVSEFHQVRRLLAVLLAVATWFSTTP